MEGMALFSSRGPTADGRNKPDIVAPGTNILSARSKDRRINPTNPAPTMWGVYNAEYVYAGGTSMATPITAGAAALVREYLIKGKSIANPSAAIIKGLLMHTAHDLFPGQFGTGEKQEVQNRPNSVEGFGRVDMNAATNLGEETIILDNSTGVATNESAPSLVVTVGTTGYFMATLNYTDAPAAASAARTLVNDLDFEVIHPNGTITQSIDNKNTTQMVELKNLPMGQYRVNIKGINVPSGRNGRQPYALVATGR